MRKRRTAYGTRQRFESPHGTAAPRKPVARNPRKDLIRLDTHSIRRKALQTHQRAELSLSKLKDQLKRYHEKDVPGFRSWVHRTFGHLLTRQRELERMIEEKRILIFEIQAMASRYGLSDLAAYRKVLWRRAHPEEAQAEDRQFEEAERLRQESRADREASSGIFGDDDPESDERFDDEGFEDEPDDEWNELFETMTGIRLPSRDPDRPHPDQKSVKELYRTIVRRLHPDHHGHMTDDRKALWHETQDAYRRHDLNALHSILARCGDGEAGLGDHSPVSLIHRLTQQLKAATQSVKREIRGMKRDVAWSYETRINNPRFVRQVEEDLEDIVGNLQWNLTDIERELTRLDRLAARQAQQGRPPKQKPTRPPRVAGQDELPF